jgi:hypothetical protein
MSVQSALRRIEDDGPLPTDEIPRDDAIACLKLGYIEPIEIVAYELTEAGRARLREDQTK